jgi:hypothetical protein
MINVGGARYAKYHYLTIAVCIYVSKHHTALCKYKLVL